MKASNELASVLWLIIGLPLTAVSVVTALTLVFSILGIVSMFIALAVPFGLAPPVLAWLFRRK
jgi:hypothetical protein